MRRLRMRTGGAITLVVALAMGLLLSGSAPGGAATGGDKSGVVPQSTGCTKTFTNAGPPALTVCVSSHGNINQIQYSPFGSAVNHINSEGYCLLDLNTFVAYHDTGLVEGGWGVATQSSTATTVTTTRTTTDGIYTLTQNVFFKYGSRMVLVGNLLKNNDTVTHNVAFDRAFDGDINGTASGDIYDVAGGSVFGQETDGLASTFLANPSLVANIGVSTFGNWSASRSTCSHTFEATPTAPGDYVGIVQGAFPIAAGATVNFRTGYRVL